MAFELGKYTQREVAKLRAFLGANARIATATPLWSVGYSNTVTEERTADRTYSMFAGNRGASFDGGRTVTLTAETQYYTMQHFAMMAGESIFEGAVDIFKVDNLEVKAGGIVTLEKEPVNGDVSVLPYVNGMIKRRPQTVTNVSGKDITLNLTDEHSVKVGDRVEVYYQYNVPEAYSLDFVDGKTPPIITLVADMVYLDDTTGLYVPAQVIYYKAQLRQDSTLSFASEGDPGSLSLAFDCYVSEVNGKNMTHTMVIYNEPDGDYSWIDVVYEDQQ